MYTNPFRRDKKEKKKKLRERDQGWCVDIVSVSCKKCINRQGNKYSVEKSQSETGHK